MQSVIWPITIDLMIVVIDDERTFVVSAEYLRTSQEGLDWFHSYPAVHLNALWLDHDLGGDDTTMPVVDLLCERAFFNDPFPIDVINVHSQNPTGADNICRALDRYYKVRRVPLPEMKP